MSKEAAAKNRLEKAMEEFNTATLECTVNGFDIYATLRLDEIDNQFIQQLDVTFIKDLTKGEVEWQPKKSEEKQ